MMSPSPTGEREALDAATVKAVADALREREVAVERFSGGTASAGYDDLARCAVTAAEPFLARAAVDRALAEVEAKITAQIDKWPAGKYDEYEHGVQLGLNEALAQLASYREQVKQ